MAAGGGDALAGRENARPAQLALVDGVAHPERDLAAQIAHAGETGEQRLLRVTDSAERVMLRVHAEPFRVGTRARLAYQMHVQIGPARRTPGQRLRAVGHFAIRTRHIAAGLHARDLAVSHFHHVRANVLSRA
jgi:hypothetical protein